MDISENEFDDVLDHVLDATDGIGQEWEALNDETVLSLLWVICKNTNKKPRPSTKRIKKRGCKGYIQATLPKNSTTVIYNTI
ncbi:8275_t:CDS:2 [Funneliformis geosporum]|uniref:8275_t:CDS:1 n=1 Tax=Funneliformis geosporum TaxID=1117311 RepID=A0A9W4SCB6_9GLOM|nr:8275_t:CDS:2 [Funneliformis geosporum]